MSPLKCSASHHFSGSITQTIIYSCTNQFILAELFLRLKPLKYEYCLVYAEEIHHSSLCPLQNPRNVIKPEKLPPQNTHGPSSQWGGSLWETTWKKRAMDNMRALLHGGGSHFKCSAMLLCRHASFPSPVSISLGPVESLSSTKDQTVSPGHRSSKQ